MRYPKIAFATFVARPNRFIARVVLDGETAETTVHVKNTGRCKELLVPGCRVVLAAGENPARKTPYDLIAVYKVTLEHPEGWLFNIDSQAPNAVVGEWLATQGFDLIRPEYTFGASRVDFYMERGAEGAHAAASAAASSAAGAAPGASAPGNPERYLLEVKGCTLEVDGIGYFPDAPTERGVKHLRELAGAAAQGYHCAVAFVIAMEGVAQVLPNVATHPEFGEALAEAQAAGVRILPLQCAVTPDSLSIVSAAAF